MLILFVDAALRASASAARHSNCVSVMLVNLLKYPEVSH